MQRKMVLALGPGHLVHLTAHRQLLCWNFLYHTWIVFSVGSSVWYFIWNLHCTIIKDSVLVKSKTQNAFLPPVLVMFHPDCPLVVKPAYTLWCLIKKLERDSLLSDMLPFAVSVLGVVLPSSEILEGLMNYPAYSAPNINRKLKIIQLCNHFCA